MVQKKALTSPAAGDSHTAKSGGCPDGRKETAAGEGTCRTSQNDRVNEGSSRLTMLCAFCGDEIVGKPVKQGGESFCSLECANRASGIDEEEEEGYFEEDPVDDFYEEGDE